MTWRIPRVADGVLHVLDPSGGAEIAVASPSWIAWLTDPETRSFSFQSPSCRYTARKEHRSRGGEYWVAYRKQGGKLHKAYLGKAEDVTLARLEDVAAVMADRGGGRRADAHRPVRGKVHHSAPPNRQTIPGLHSAFYWPRAMPKSSN
jgi:hypothetical protein